MGKGRFLHRKPVLAAEATLEIHAGLPDFASQGIFAAPGTFPAVALLSNGAFDIQANTKPDIRGFAIRVLNVSGLLPFWDHGPSGFPPDQPRQFRQPDQ